MRLSSSSSIPGELTREEEQEDEDEDEDDLVSPAKRAGRASRQMAYRKSRRRTRKTALTSNHLTQGTTLAPPAGREVKIEAILPVDVS
jgi:hypothetical protein